MDFTTMPDFASALDKLRRERAQIADAVSESPADNGASGVSSNENSNNNFEQRELVRKDTAAVMSAATSTPIPAFPSSTPPPTSTSTSTSSSRAHSSAAALFGGRGVQAVADAIDEEEMGPQVTQADDEEFPSLEKAFNAKPEVAAVTSPVQTAQSLFSSTTAGFAEPPPAPVTSEGSRAASAYATPGAERVPEAHGDRSTARIKPPTPSNIVDARPVDTVAALAKKTAALSVVAAFQDSKPSGNANFLNVNARLQQQLDASEAAIAAPNSVTRQERHFRVEDDDDDEGEGESDEEPLDLWSASSSDDTLDGGGEAESVAVKRSFPPQPVDLGSIYTGTTTTGNQERQVEAPSSPRVPPLDQAAASAIVLSAFSGSSFSPENNNDGMSDNSDEEGCDERANLSSPDLPYSQTTSPKLSLKSASTILMQRAKTKLMSELRAAKQLALQSSEEFRAQTRAVLKNAGEMHRMLENLTHEKDEACITGIILIISFCRSLLGVCRCCSGFGSVLFAVSALSFLLLLLFHHVKYACQRLCLDL